MSKGNECIDILVLSVCSYALTQGRSHKMLSGQVEIVEAPTVPLILDCIFSIVQSTISMLILGGSGGMPPQENFEKYMH